MIDYDPQLLARPPAPQIPGLNTRWSPQDSDIMELQQQILDRSREIVDLSRKIVDLSKEIVDLSKKLQASRSQTRHYVMSQDTPYIAPPRIRDLVNHRQRVMDTSQQIADLSQRLRDNQLKTMQINQNQNPPSMPWPLRDTPPYLSSQAMGNNQFLNTTSQNAVIPRGSRIGGSMHRPQQIMDYSQQIADLSGQLWASQLQSMQINQDLSSPRPLHQPSQNTTNGPFPISHNAPYTGPFQSSYPSCPTVGNTPAYYPSAAKPSTPISALGFVSRQWTGSLPNTLTPPSPVTQISLTPTTQSSGFHPIPYYHQYGDCGESLPLVAMTNLLRLTGRAEVRSVTAFTTKLREMAFVLENGPIRAPLRLRDPCLNCESLMQRLPGTVNMLAASGWSYDTRWVAVNHPAYVPGTDPPSREFYASLKNYEFSLSAAYVATRGEIYATLEVCTLANTNPFIFANPRKYLADLWYGFIVPYRDNGSIFRLDGDDNVKPIMLETNGIIVPICTVFCAMGYILSTVLWPDRVAAQRASCYLPLMAVLAKWCHTLCPWGHPNVINVAYITSREPDIDTPFLLGTSKPSAKADAPPEAVQPKHTAQMRSIRKVLLEGHFGKLPNPCPVKLAAEKRYLPRN